MGEIKDYSAVLRAAGDPIRARILKMLEEGDLCVCQINAVLGLSQSTVSKHLLVLKAAGLIKGHKEGRWVFNGLASRKMNDYALPILALLKGWLLEDKIMREDAKKIKEVKKLDPHELCAKGVFIFGRNKSPKMNMNTACHK